MYMGFKNLTGEGKYTGMRQSSRIYKFFPIINFYCLSKQLTFLLEHAVAEIKTLKHAGRKCSKEMSFYTTL
jgi:hypothetical protein